MQLRGLRTNTMSVRDLESAKSWYTELLGFDPYFDEPFYVGYDVAGYEFGLAHGEPGVGGSVSYWAVEDPEGLVTRAVGMGATAREEVKDVGEGIVLGTVIDPFGNEFGVIRNPHFAPHLTFVGSDDLADEVITVSVEVPSGPRAAWDLWATNDGLAAWWTPHTQIDLRPGGAYEIHFNPEAAPGDRGGDWCRVLSFLPGSMLSFTWNAPPELKTRPLHTWVVALFEETAVARCRVTLSHYGWPKSGLADPDSDWPATLEYFKKAWEYVIGLFSSHFEPE
ncbi:MAG: SRPBCC domain-containing protein [Acidimicrobiia bacterium]|nr:SRPBCC domain-containing protein [Acidimicrobiia bacterium]